MKTIKKQIALALTVVLVFTCMVFPASAASTTAFDILNSSNYAKVFTLSGTGITIPYTNETLSTRGTLSYGANRSSYIANDTDELYLFDVGCNTSGQYWALVSYPTASRRVIAYIPLSAITSNNAAHTKTSSAGKFYTSLRENGSLSSSHYVAKGDTVYLISTSSSKYQILYPIPGGYRLAWCSKDDYSKYCGTPSTSQPVPNGTYVIISYLDQNKAVDIYGASSDDCANANLWTRNNTPAQDFELIYHPDGYYTIVNTHSGKALDVAYGVAACGTNVHQYHRNGTAAQRWYLENAGDGWFYIRSALGNNLYLDVNGAQTNDGTNIQIWVGKNNAQKFRFERKDSSTATSNNYAAYTGVNYREQTSDPRRIAACDKAVRMATVLWRADCTFPTWRSSGGGYNTVTATDNSSDKQFVAGKTYQGIPYSMAGRTYDDEKWISLVKNGLTTNLMTGKYYTSKADTTAKGIDCSYLVCVTLNESCGTSINLNTIGMLNSSSFKKINRSQILPGDIFLSSGHVMLFMGKTADGRYAVIEANANYSRVVYRELSASAVSSYGCYRYTGFM